MEGCLSSRPCVGVLVQDDLVAEDLVDCQFLQRRWGESGIKETVFAGIHFQFRLRFRTRRELAAGALLQVVDLVFHC